MSQFSVIRVFAALAFVASTGVPAAAAPHSRQLAASVPTYPNASCPIMGKPVSTRLFAETERGRIYVCCKGCVKDILADVETAYRTSFPEHKKMGNAKCPVTGDSIQKDSPVVQLQGYEFFVRDLSAVKVAQKDSQLVLAKLNDPKLVDVANKICPISGDATVQNAFVVVEGHIVRLASPKHLSEVEKDPAATLAKAKALREQEERR